MKKLKILIVDDEADFLELISARVAGWGYEVIEAVNGQEAIKVFNSRKPDIIILDYLMPGMDGIAVLREIRQLDQRMPVIMFTAHPDAQSIKDTQELGVSAFIPKLSLYQDAQSALKTAVDMIIKKLGKGE